MKEKKLQLIFTAEETVLYGMLEQYCAGKNISVETYVKELILRDLAWGHFSKRKKRQGKNST
jgi:hypothetical protein